MNHEKMQDENRRKEELHRQRVAQEGQPTKKGWRKEDARATKEDAHPPTSTSLLIRRFVYMYASMYVCMYVCMYIYIYTYEGNSSFESAIR